MSDASENANLKVSAKHSSSCFDLVEPRGMAQVEESINLRHVPTQAPGQLGLLDSLLGHGLINAQLRAFQGRWANGPLSALSLTWKRQRFARLNVKRECRFQRVDSVQQSFAFIGAESQRFRNIGESHQNGIAISGQDHGVVKHWVASLQSELTLDRGLKPFAQLSSAVHRERGLLAVQEYFEMRTLSKLKGGALLLQPLLHLFRVHSPNTKHFCCVGQGPEALA